ncbi:methyltransferase domain-containing protein [Shewanella aestuarii]|uniref:Class I SAM-dependent methyltransferase n=1 Tax=Shewanella aestuarii TaxID=1028752 RepID=A0A6G9QLG6_9GAMM|nr:class I SAM-dependent methyltransferase [Shewanella aestuarii]QIR14681.1 class I SAM-dependent methyltransferase [Shewanella aestuarii]
MTTDQIFAYFQNTKNRDTRDDLVFAVSKMKHASVAIDCGCGAGSDILYLRKQGFTVYAFDIESQAISICEERFGVDDKVILTKDSFTSFNYPSASLINADASLFFCRQEDFDNVWANISGALVQNGIFCGSFLGPEDSMASGDINKGAYWPDVLVFQEHALKALFDGFNILKFTEHRVSGKLSNGSPTFWHIYSVVAQRI